MEPAEARGQTPAPAPERLAAASRGLLPPFADARAVPPAASGFWSDYGLAAITQSPDVRYRAGTVTSADFTLVAHSWEQPGATSNLLVVHGYFDHSGLYGRLIENGLAQGCNVLAFDLPGHGLSSGDRGVIGEFREYGDAIAAVMAASGLPGLPWWVMAQSMGAAALIEYARGHHWPFQAAVLLAPLVRPAGWYGIVAAHRLIGRLVTSVRRDFAVNSSDADFLALVKADPLQSRRVPVAWISALRRWLGSLPRTGLGVGPALVIQGDNDRTVDWRYNLPVIERLFPGSRVERVPGGGHHLANESRALRDPYLQVVNTYVARKLASGPRATAR